MTFAVAGILLGVFAITGGSASYKQVLSVYVHSGVIGTVAGAINAVINYFMASDTNVTSLAGIGNAHRREGLRPGLLQRPRPHHLPGAVRARDRPRRALSPADPAHLPGSLRGLPGHRGRRRRRQGCLCWRFVGVHWEESHHRRRRGRPARRRRRRQRLDEAHAGQDGHHREGADARPRGHRLGLGQDPGADARSTSAPTPWAASRSWPSTRGRRVKKGQFLMQIDPRNQRTADRAQRGRPGRGAVAARAAAQQRSPRRARTWRCRARTCAASRSCGRSS